MSITRGARGVFHPDVVVVGAGLIGLTCATEVARNERNVLVISSNEPGSASSASAGILAPSVGHPPGPIRSLGRMSRDMYPAYLESLAERTEVRVPLDRAGVLEVAFTDEEAVALRATLAGDAEWIEAHMLARLEPALAPAVGAVLHQGDGAVDSAALLTALGVDSRRDARIMLRDSRVARLDTTGTPLRLVLESGDEVEAPAIVLAAGAWVGALAGLPRALPVTPVRGQIVTLPGTPLRHVVMSATTYVVSRGGRSLVGSTMEWVGFDAGTTDAGARLLRARAREMSPALASNKVLEHWAGLRPVTPDFLPLVGPDPDCEGLFYACGHSRNGVLLAPLTAAVTAAFLGGGPASVDVSPYAPGRFWPGR